MHRNRNRNRGRNEDSNFGGCVFVCLVFVYVMSSSKNHKEGDPHTKDNLSPLQAAVQRGNASAVRRLLDDGADIEARTTPSGDTALHLAAGAGQLELLQLLVERGADLNARSHNGTPPLLLAVARSFTPGVRVLLAGGCDVNLRLPKLPGVNAAADHDGGLTALELAVSRGLTEAVGLMLETRIPVPLKPHDHPTALHFAAAAGHVPIGRLLLAAGFVPDWRAPDGRTPLHAAVGSANAPFATLLLRAGADCEAEDAAGRTALYLAVSGRQHDLKELLVLHGCRREVPERWRSVAADVL